MSNPVQFQSFNFHSNAVRVITDPTGEFWFCGTDVCSILGYTNAPKALKDHCKEKGITKRYTLTEKGNQELIFINEPNLYRLIIKSRKPEAEPFEAWVFEEVLPQIRKTGSYSQNNQPNPPLADIRADEDVLALLIKLHGFGLQAREMQMKLHGTSLARQIENAIGGQYLHNFQYPLQQTLDTVKDYIQAKSERIMFVKGMLNLLEPTANTRLTNR